MRLIVVVLSIFGFALGVLVVGPRLIAWSPWLAVVVLVVVLLVTSYFEVRHREKRLDRQARQRPFPPASGR